MTRLVDYFVLCGLRGQLSDVNAGGIYGIQPPLSRSYACQIAYHYPNNLDYLPFDEAAIKMQCMPDGLQLMKNFNPLPKFHTMIITRENGTHVYGSVLVFYEPIADQTILDSVLTLQNEYESNCRFGISPDESLLYNPTADELYSSASLCFVTTVPVFSPLKVYLEQLYAITMEGEHVSLPIESYLYNLLYEVCLPDPGRTVSFSGPLGSLNWYFPGKSDLPLCDYSFRTLFEHLGVKNVLKFLSCVLLEQQIFLKSSDFFLLMLCSECITSLLFPFSWPHVFVPILPASQKAFLDAPVPFIMGLRMDTESINEDLDVINKASLCTVNIDLGIVEVSEDIPPLPDQERLIQRLSDILLQYNVYCPGINENHIPHSPTDRNKKTVIIDAIRYFKSMSEGPQPSPSSSRRGGGIPLTHSSSLTKVTDHPIVKEIQGIMVRSGSGKNMEDSKEDVITSVSPTTGILSNDNDNDDNDDCKDVGAAGKWEYREDETEVSFTTDIRTVFLNYFVEHFANYEHFSILPNQTYQQWIRNREQFLNFDKTAFLSDQPINYRPFYSAFLETSMFTNMIDQKLISWWVPEMTSLNLLLFDKCVESYRQNNGIPTTPSAGNTPGTPNDFNESSGISQGSELAPKPHSLTSKESNVKTIHRQHGVFPSLDSSLLNYEVESTITTNKLPKTSQFKPTSKRLDGSTSTSAFSHSKFVMQLWRESRSRVKHMLGSSAEAQSNIEANTQIANLCDLLERIWGHGLKKRETKSPLWSHLIAFGELLCHEEATPISERNRTLSTPNVYYPHSSTATSRGFTKSHMTSKKLSVDESSSPQTRRTLPLARQKLRSPALKMRIEGIIQPPSSSFLDDLQIVNNMREIKTDVGRARAWVRLALEKKSLSTHLTQLLSNMDLCKKRYRHYSFLLTEDEKEQFLFHLLSLSAGDFICFTTGFITTTMCYKLLIIGEGKYFGLTTASLYVNVGGENTESGILTIPKGEYQLEFTCPNLGILTCLRLGHDNSGLVRSLMVEMVLILCITTGQTYKFNCCRPLSRADDDGSIERLLFAERISRKLNGSSNISALCINDVIPSNSASNNTSASVMWTRSPRKETGEKPMLSDIKSSFTNCICRMLKVLDNTPKETTREKLISLLYGTDGFIKCFIAVLNFGFKLTRTFQKRCIYLWDVIEKCIEEVPCPHSQEPHPNVTEEAISDDDETEEHNLRERGGVKAGGGSFIVGQSSNSHQWRHFINLVAKINSFTRIGKYEKVVILFSIGIRDKNLATWIQLLASSSVIELFYEPTSFLRDPELLAYLLQTVEQTKTLYYIKCEPLLVQGL